jgi:enoyl-CoA hydratase/carnithine racemase
MKFFQEEYRLNHIIHDYPKPYIALMHGITMGGGVGISLHGSHPVAASSSFVFAMPETTIGFFPDVGASYLLSRCPGKMGVYLGLTGNRLHANEACAAGLVKYVVEPSAFEAVIGALHHIDLSANAHDKVSACLDSFHQFIHAESFDELRTKIDSAFACADMISLMEGLKSHDEPWYREIANTLDQKSPLSLCVTLAQLNKAAYMNFDECIHMDYCLAQHFMEGHDFYEGVRALLIDKDKSPQWSPKTLSLVNISLVKEYFAEIQ